MKKRIRLLATWILAYLLLHVLCLFLAEWCISTTTFGGRFLRTAFSLGRILFFVFTAIALAGALLPDSKLKFLFQAIGNIWLGFFVYFGGILLISCGVYVLISKLDGRTDPSGRGIILIFSFTTALILLIYGLLHARRLKVRSYEIKIPKKAGNLHELTLVLIADLHLSANSSPHLADDLVRLVNEQKPDLVAAAGDVFTSSHGALGKPDRYAASLRRMHAEYGVYAVYGNHDVEEALLGGFPIAPKENALRSREMEQFMEACGFTVLCDESVLIAEDAFYLTGRVDADRSGDGTNVRLQAKELLAGLDKEKPVIVLQHEPTEFSELKEYGADLALCGHTHAGQIFPGNLIVPFFNENGYGYRNIAGLDTIVTAGAGCYGPPMRVGTDSEIAVVHIKFL